VAGSNRNSLAAPRHRAQDCAQTEAGCVDWEGDASGGFDTSVLPDLKFV
jgi:hypothetical protein